MDSPRGFGKIIQSDIRWNLDIMIFKGWVVDYIKKVRIKYSGCHFVNTLSRAVLKLLIMVAAITAT